MPSAYLQWQFHSGERVVAHGPCVFWVFFHNNPSTYWPCNAFGSFLNLCKLAIKSLFPCNFKHMISTGIKINEAQSNMANEIWAVPLTSEKNTHCHNLNPCLAEP